MPQKRTYRLLIASIFTILVSVSMLLFAFRVIKHKNQYASALSQTIESKITQEENVSEFKKVIEDTKEQHELLQSFVVKQSKIDEFATYLETEGDAVGVPINIQNVEISAVDPSVVLISFDGVSNFENVMHLVWVIEHAPYKIKITSLSLNYAIGSRWQLNMKIEAVSS